MFLVFFREPLCFLAKQLGFLPKQLGFLPISLVGMKKIYNFAVIKIIQLSEVDK